MTEGLHETQKQRGRGHPLLFGLFAGFGVIGALPLAVFFAAAAGDFFNQHCAQFGMRVGNCSDARDVMLTSGGLMVLPLAALVIGLRGTWHG